MYFCEINLICWVMKMKCLTYLLLSVITLGFLFTSCDGDDSAYSQNIEGHWIYLGTKTDVHVTDTTIRKMVDDYILNRGKENKISYEFKNDRTYYFYQNNDDPMKGIFKPIDMDYFIMDDIRGMKTVAREDTIIYVVSDLRKEIARELNIDEYKLVKAMATDTFKRGLFSE